MGACQPSAGTEHAQHPNTATITQYSKTMKKTIIFSTVGLIAVNLLAGVILSRYHLFNVTTTSVVILLNGCLNYIAATIPLKDAYRVAHYYLFSLLGVVMFLLMLSSPHQLKDNWCVVVSIIIVAIESITLYITYRTSKNQNQ